MSTAASTDGSATLTILALGSQVLQKSEIEGNKHQNNADIRCQSLPESVPKKQQIYTYDNGYHYQNVKQNIDISLHFSHHPVEPVDVLLSLTLAFNNN